MIPQLNDRGNTGNTGGMGGIVWLASYPKSGNTWFRAFYTNLLEDGDTPVSIDRLGPRFIASSRMLFDSYAGVESSDLTLLEIERLRPRVYEDISRQEGKTGAAIFMKIHDAFTINDEGHPIISPEATRGALYFLRNPLDVAVSFAHHNACDIDSMIRRMADENYCFSDKPGTLFPQFRQRLCSWSSHVTGWVEGLGERLHLMRYEDMVLNTEETFTRAVQFAGLPDDPARIRKALDFSEIGEMQKQEQSTGFKEKKQKARSFFRKGKIGSWRGVLTHSQVQRIIHDHYDVMKQFNYLDQYDRPLF